MRSSLSKPGFLGFWDWDFLRDLLDLDDWIGFLRIGFLGLDFLGLDFLGLDLRIGFLRIGFLRIGF